MNYIWELILKADQENIARESFFFRKANNPNPYVEVSIENLNAGTIHEMNESASLEVEVNPLYRFHKEFGQLFSPDTEGFEQTRAIFFDICMHYIAQIDLREGLSRQDFYIQLLREDIHTGKFGNEAKEAFLLFSRKEGKQGLRALLHLFRNKNYMQEFRQIVKEIYPKSYLYENNEFANEILLYLGKKKTEEEEKRIGFLIKFFLPMQETVHIFYDHHFGIIGIDETMRLEEMMLF